MVICNVINRMIFGELGLQLIEDSARFKDRKIAVSNKSKLYQKIIS